MPATDPSFPARAVRRDAQANRAAILDAAALLLQDDVDAGLDRIATAAGLSRRAIYGHFASRDELVEELLVRGAVRVTSALLPLDDADPAVAIATIGARLWREVAHVRTTARLAVRGPFRERVGAATQPLRDIIERIVAAGIEQGVFRQDVAAPTLARLIEGAALDVLDEATRTGLDDREAERLVVVTTLSCAGLGWTEAAGYVARVRR